MSNYYTNFSVILPLNKEQQEYALQLVKSVEAYRNEGKPLADVPDCIKEVVEDWPFEVEAVDQGIWLQSENGGQETVCVLIQHLLQKFDFAPYIAFEWSYDCDKPKPDAFGGGAAFITSTEIETFTTSSWLEKMKC